MVMRVALARLRFVHSLVQILERAQQRRFDASSKGGFASRVCSFPRGYSFIYCLFSALLIVRNLPPCAFRRRPLPLAVATARLSLLGQNIIRGITTPFVLLNDAQVNLD